MKSPSRPQGMVLISVMAIIAMAAMIATSLMFMIRADAAAAASAASGEQAYAAAMSGIRAAMAIVQTNPDDPTLWYDNPQAFQNQLVAQEGGNDWYFTVFAAAPGGEGVAAALRYGLSDEAGKINLNLADEATLAALPGLTPDLLAALLDYRDADDEARPQGAEQDYYDSLPQPYTIANGAMLSLDELLLVKGFSAAIVYGEDSNLNGLLDPHEDDGNQAFPPDDANGQLDRGLRSLLTPFSTDSDVNSQGAARVALNGDPAALASLGLSEQTLRFLRIYRGEGKTFAHPSQLLEMRYTLTRDWPQEGDLKAGQEIESHVGPSELALVMDKLTTRQGNARASLVNVNTAPLEVLGALPGMNRQQAQQAIDTRGTLDAAARATTAWLVTQNVLDAQTYQAVAPQLTSRSRQFLIRCIGFGWPSGRYRVFEAVVDLAQGPPRIVCLREDTRLGLPLPLGEGLVFVP